MNRVRIDGAPLAPERSELQAWKDVAVSQ